MQQPFFHRFRRCAARALQAFALLAASASAAAATVAQAGEAVLVRNVRVVDIGSGRTRQQNLLIEGGRIAQAGAPGQVSQAANARIIEAEGLYAIPGLWDMHVHLTHPPMKDRVLPLLLAHGVTSVRDTGGALEEALALRERSRKYGEFMPRVFVAGPVLDGVPRAWRGEGSPDAMIEVATPAAVEQQVDALAAAKVDFVKLYEMMRPEVLVAAVNRAHRYGLKVTAHVPARMTVPAVLDAGLDGIEHLRGLEFDCAKEPEKLHAQRVAIMDAHDRPDGGYGLRRKVHETVRPEAFATQDPARCAALVKRFAEQGTWHTPTLHFVAFRALRYHRDPEWLDAYRYLAPEQRERRLKLVEEFTDETKYVEWEDHGHWSVRMVGELHRAGVPLLAGTDSPGFIFMPGTTLHDELQALVQAGLTPLTALQAATINPARYFGVDGELGTVAAGKIADILLIEGDPLADIRNTRRIAAVIARGRVYDRAALDSALARFDSGWRPQGGE